MKPIKNEIVFKIEEVLIDSNFDQQTIKEEVLEVIPPTPAPSTSMTKKTSIKTAKQTPKLKFIEKTCIYCQKELVSYNEMVEHNKNHKECPICLKNFDTFKRFRVHYKYVHLDAAETNPKFPCNICGKEFQRKKNMSYHVRSFHNEERNFGCDICQKTFFTRAGLVKHQVLHTEERPYVCTVCKKDFKSLQGLTYHEKSHEEKKRSDQIKRNKNKIFKSYICTYCGKQSRGLTAFQVHQRIHTNELPYECKVCNKKFRALNSLTTHNRIHTGEKPYQCDLCSASFRVQHYLTTHKLSHGGNNVEKFSCNLCGMSTVYEKNLDTHMKTVHMQVKNFDCKTCSESFSKISLLKAHMMESHNLL